MKATPRRSSRFRGDEVEGYHPNSSGHTLVPRANWYLSSIHNHGDHLPSGPRLTPVFLEATFYYADACIIVLLTTRRSLKFKTMVEHAMSDNKLVVPSFLARYPATLTPA
ncbi:hypothetical protein HGRIS_009337 [Hohenbuehelia grisea]|uniref:Uncharacterized protein n=1 Tax=Hohenbuehelia grisea TaxID=104357 RepID=A0ABR3J0Z4_9AGAR